MRTVTWINAGLLILANHTGAGARYAVMICILSEDPSVIKPHKALFHDRDFDVRFYAKQGVKELENK